MKEKKDMKTSLDREKKDRAKKEKELHEKIRSLMGGEETEQAIKELKDAIQEKEAEIEGN